MAGSRSRRLLLASLTACALSMLPGTPKAAPAMRLIVPYPPGGATDQVARLLAGALAAQMHAPVYVDNRPGASGTIGTLALARAAPDGQTLGIGTVSTLVLLPRLRDTGYHALHSFEPVGSIGAAPLIVVATPHTPAANLQELVQLLRQRPGAYNFASVGEGSLPHLAGDRFQALTGTTLVHIPYPGSPTARLDLLAGRVHLMFDQLATFSTPSLRDGPLRPLAVMGPWRLAMLPTVPTTAEAGLPALRSTMWMGLLAPAGTPAAVVEAINRQLQAALEDPQLRQALAELGIEPDAGSPQAFRRFIAEQLQSSPN